MTFSKQECGLKHFVDGYNNDHRHSGINYFTPNERHTGLDKASLEERIKVYEAARVKHPERWTRGIRKWDVNTQTCDKVFRCR